MIELNDEEIDLIKTLIKDKLAHWEYNFELDIMYNLLNKCEHYLNSI